MLANLSNFRDHPASDTLSHMDEFSDDEFDELNDTVYQELEKNAIQATQAASKALPPHQHRQAHQNQNYVDLTQDDGPADYDDDAGLDHSVVTEGPHQLRPPLAVTGSSAAHGPRRVVPVQ